MATFTALPIKVDGGYSQHHGRQGDEAASQTFKDGNLISADTNGRYQATPAGAGATTVKNRIAAAPGQNLAVPTRRTEYTDPNQHGAVEVSAMGVASTAALIKAGATYGYSIDATTGLGVLNLADTTNAVFTIVDNRLRRGNLGDTGVRVLARFVAGVI
jgi:hypothetical protein